MATTISGAMTADSKRSFRRLILIGVLKHLESVYDLDFPPGTVSAMIYSHSGTDSLFSFRSDPRLNELSAALARLESGTFGTCAACKKMITRTALESDITIRVCPSCEAAITHPPPDQRPAVLQTRTQAPGTPPGLRS